MLNLRTCQMGNSHSSGYDTTVYYERVLQAPDPIVVFAPLINILCSHDEVRPDLVDTTLAAHLICDDHSSC